MAAYAVTGHIHQARPHRPGPVAKIDASVSVVADVRPTAVPEDLTMTLFAGLDPDGKRNVGATWFETTFFLFDPESWR